MPSAFHIYNPTLGKKYGVDEALDIIGRGPFQNYVFLACGMSLMYVMAETLGVSYIIPPAKCDLELDTMRKGILSSVSVFGIALTSHVSGFLTDQLGRKRTVFMSILMSTCLSAVSALVPGFWTMVLFRLMAGMSIAAAASGTFAYMSEFFPVKFRATAIMLGSALGAISTAVMPILGLIIQRYHWEVPILDSYIIYGWRIQLLSHLTPGLVALLLLRRLPESPKYLMTANQPEECLRVLHLMYEKNSKLPPSQCTVQELKTSSDSDTRTNPNKSLKDFCGAIVHETGLLFKPPLLKLITSCCFIQFGCFVIAGGFGLWYPELTNRISDAQQDDMGFCDIFLKPTHVVNSSQIVFEERSGCVTVVHEDMYVNNMALGLAHILGFFALALCLNKISLKTTLSVVLFFGCLCGFVLQHIREPTLVLVIFVLFILGSGVSISLVNATAVDLFPTHLRGMAIAMSILVGRMGTVVGANAIGFLLDFNCSFTYYGMGLLALVCALISVYLPKKNYNNP